MTQQDYYEILGVPQEADQKEIKEAYRKLALAYHPDRHQDQPEMLEKMQAINEAYAVLSHEDKRRDYDAMRHQFGSFAYDRFRQNYSNQDIFNGSDIFHIFEEMTRSFGFRGYNEIFREFGAQGGRFADSHGSGGPAQGFSFTRSPGGQGPISIQVPKGQGVGKIARFFIGKIGGVEFVETGRDSEDRIYLSPEQARNGGAYAYYHRRQKKKLIVHIPRQIRSGQRIRLSGQGEPGTGGGPSGDLYLRVEIRQPLMQGLKDRVRKIFK